VLDQGTFTDGVDTIRGKQQAIAELQFERLFADVEFRDRLAGQGAHQHVAFVARVGFYRVPGLGHAVEVTAVAVIGVELAQLAFAHQVEMTVADADPPQAVFDGEYGDQGRTHALKLWAFGSPGLDRVVTGLQAGTQQVGWHPIREALLDRVTQGADGQLAGQFTGGVTAHAIGNNQQYGVLLIVERNHGTGIFLVVTLAQALAPSGDQLGRQSGLGGGGLSGSRCRGCHRFGGRHFLLLGRDCLRAAVETAGEVADVEPFLVEQEGGDRAARTAVAVDDVGAVLLQPFRFRPNLR